MNTPDRELPAYNGPMYSREFAAKSAEDSTRIVTRVTYNLSALTRGPNAFRMSLLCRMSRVAIISVRRTLSDKAIE